MVVSLLSDGWKNSRSYAFFFFYPMDSFFAKLYISISCFLSEVMLLLSMHLISHVSSSFFNLQEKINEAWLCQFIWNYCMLIHYYTIAMSIYILSCLICIRLNNRKARLARTAKDVPAADVAKSVPDKQRGPMLGPYASPDNYGAASNARQDKNSF